jgi:hypothetical protein
MPREPGYQGHEFAMMRTKPNQSIILDLTYGPAPPLGDLDFDGTVAQSDLDYVLLR